VGIVDETLKVLERIPIWKRLGEIPAEVDDLKQRLAVLEGQLNGKWPADVCRYCGARAVRLARQFGRPDIHGLMVEEWACGDCGRVDERRVKPR